ncbi:MAG: double-strand break repair helicase AddA [Hyphomicrobiales bacterium]
MNEVATPRIQADVFQARASNPQSSSWVSANAGSGKTYVLVNRIVRLLLAGNESHRILCLTYTRAAAAVMESRLFERLSGWIKLSDAELAEEIAGLNAGAAWNGKLEHARQLFTRALETPGGLKIQTIHAFCEGVLQRFPVEAKVTPGFTILDDRTSREWLKSVREKVLADAVLAPDSPRGKALAAVSGITHAGGFEDVLEALLAQRSEVAAAWSTPEKGAAAKQALKTALGIQEGETVETIAEAGSKVFPQDLMEEAITAMRTGAKRDNANADAIEQIKSSNTGPEKWANILNYFFNKDGAIPTSPDFLMSAKTAKSHEDLRERLLDIQAETIDIEDRRKAAITWQASNGLFTLASEILTEFQSEKRRRGQLDYTDLIIYTRDLLCRAGEGWPAWVMFRLDNGIDHVLIDEAQDTSPRQWEIVNALTQEFFTGEGARPEIDRTVFAVGDRKQSIYSFQGADPDGFDRQRSETSRLARAANEGFEAVNLNVSFRSAKTVLDAVDLVFTGDELAANGVAETTGEWPTHQATRTDADGLVEVWPMVEKPERVDLDPFAPVDQAPASHHHILLAQEIAGRIANWLDPETQKASGRNVTPGDILILVRNRGILAEALVRALVERNIPVAGADRLQLSNHIAVMDLLALSRAVSLPQDEYSLACVLKSPLVFRDDSTYTACRVQPITDDDLIALAAARKGSLWSALASAGKPYAQALERLKRWRGLAGYMRPFEFFSYVLGPDRGRALFHNRLGAEADDPIDEFLGLALEFETTHAPSVRGFAEWMSGDDAQIKREMDQAKNEVRVMTVHGAKGLESNIVILPDTNNVPNRRKVDDVLSLGKSETNPGVPVWKLKSALQPKIVSDYVEHVIGASLKEENRLLYVAMTRAKNELYVCGAGNMDELDPECWYAKVHGLISRHGSEIENAEGDTVSWRMGEPVNSGAVETVQVATPAAIEPWMKEDAPDEPPEPRPLAPSRLDFDTAAGATKAKIAETPALSPLDNSENAAFLRGKLIHRLLQTLPDVVPDKRKAAADIFLAQQSAELSEELRNEIARQVFSIIDSDDDDLRTLFAPGSLAEVPVTARISEITGPTGAPVVISGVIDRLAVGGDVIHLADFKTNRNAPTKPEDADILYIRQLAAYSLALKKIYPDRPVKAWLVWTQNGVAMEIPQSFLESAFT